MLTVQARNVQTLNLERLHFKLNITKERDHTTYEIDGTEQKFADISSLLSFYKYNPLTRDRPKLTIGEACTPH